ANEPRSRQIFLRGDADAVRFHLIGHRAIAGGHRVAGIQYDLALEWRGVIAPDLRQRTIRYGKQHDVAKGDRLIDRAGLRQGSETRDHVLEFLGMARGEQDLMAVLDPESADGAADMTGTNGSDRH